VITDVHLQIEAVPQSSEIMDHPSASDENHRSNLYAQSEPREMLLPGTDWDGFMFLRTHEHDRRPIRRSPYKRKARDVTTTLATSPLQAHDRCDSCGAQAYIRVVLSEGELLFCGHHGRHHEAKLREIAVEWHDETARLIDSNTPTAEN
jgi:hypothetical protein